MKLILLVDGEMGEFENILELLDRTKTQFLDTHSYLEKNEYAYITESIDGFIRSGKEIMLIRFSGREDIPKQLGDEFSEMIVSLSYNELNSHYAENPLFTFIDLIHSFYKETD